MTIKPTPKFDDNGKGWQILLLVQITIIFLSLSVFSMGLRSLSAAVDASARQNIAEQPMPPQQPVQHEKSDIGQAATVDYQQIDSMIRNRVAELPKPIDGVRGQDGVSAAGSDGSDGKGGQDGTSGKSAYQTWLDQGNVGTEQDFLLALKGAPGQDAIGAPGREIELQSNPLNGNLEWRYIGDDSWQLLLNKCKITDTCPAP